MTGKKNRKNKKVGEGLLVVATNKKAYHEYIVYEKYEAGIVLTGTEIKSVRKSSINIKEGYAEVEGGNVTLRGVHISHYFQGNQFNVAEVRPRRLLLHKKQIYKIAARLSEEGFTLIPLRVYINKKGKAKVELGLCKGKKLYDKRKSIAEKDAKRQMSRLLKQRSR